MAPPCPRPVPASRLHKRRRPQPRRTLGLSGPRGRRRRRAPRGLGRSRRCRDSALSRRGGAKGPRPGPRRPRDRALAPPHPARPAAPRPRGLCGGRLGPAPSRPVPGPRCHLRHLDLHDAAAACALPAAAAARSGAALGTGAAVPGLGAASLSRPSPARLSHSRAAGGGARPGSRSLVELPRRGEERRGGAGRPRSRRPRGLPRAPLPPQSVGHAPLLKSLPRRGAGAVPPARTVPGHPAGGSLPLVTAEQERSRAALVPQPPLASSLRPAFKTQGPGSGSRLSSQAALKEAISFTAYYNHPDSLQTPHCAGVKGPLLRRLSLLHRSSRPLFR